MSREEAGYGSPNSANRSAVIASPADLLAESAVGIVHDLGNLIQIASSAMNIIARAPNVRAVPDLDPVIAGARLSLDRAGTLLYQIMQVRDRHKTEQHASVSACLTGLAALIRSSWGPGFHLDVQASPHLPMVKCSPLDLQNAILNLVFNACAAMPGGGLISIAAVKVPQGDAVAGVEIRIEDNGLGMTRETMRRAFDPFFTTKTKGLGGLGLPIVKRFILEAGGRIDLESEPGVGTTVTLRLPCASQSRNSDRAMP